MNIYQAANENGLIIGDKVDIVAPTGQIYRTMIEDQHEKGPYLCGVPSRKGLQLPVHEGDDVYLVFYREDGRYVANMKVIVVEMRSNGRYMWLLQKAVAQKQQRREAYRLPIMFDVVILEHIDDSNKNIVNGVIFDEPIVYEYETASSRDISITGVALTTKKRYAAEERYLLRMYLDRTPANVRDRAIDEGAPPLEVTASVKRSVPWRDTNYYNTGFHFIGMSKNMSEGLSRFVLAEQQKQIKKRQLL